MSNAITTNYYDYVDKKWRKLDSTQFPIVVEGSRGGRNYNLFGMVQYLGQLGIIFYNGFFYQWQSDFIREPDQQEKGGCYVRLDDNQIKDAIQLQQIANQIVINVPNQNNTINTQESALSWSLVEPKLRRSFEMHYGQEHYNRYLDEDGKLSIVAFDDGWMNLSDSKHWYDNLEPDPCFFVTESDRIHTIHPYASQTLTESLITILKCFIPNEDSIRSFFEMAGYIFFSRTMFPPYIFHFHGKGRTGKSLIADWIQDIIGNENVSRLSILAISKDFGAVNLIGKRLNIATETETSIASQYTPIDTELLKKLSGGEIIDANRKHKGFVHFYNTAKLLFCSNNQMVLGDSSSGMNRRVITWRFKIEQENTSELKEILYDPTTKLQLVEQQLEGWKRVLEHKEITLSDENREENKKREAYDSRNQFIQYRWEGMSRKAIQWAVEDEHPTISDLYNEYELFCADNRFKPVSKIKFNARLEDELGLIKKRLGSGLYWCGVKR